MRVQQRQHRLLGPLPPEASEGVGCHRHVGRMGWCELPLNVTQLCHVEMILSYELPQ